MGRAQRKLESEVERLLTIDDMCLRYGVTPTAWRNRELCGEAPPSFKAGKRKYWRLRTVETWEEAREREAQLADAERRHSA